MWLPGRDEALGFLETHLVTTNLVRHCIATEAIMRSLARRFGEDEDLWGVTGLFHDLDLDLVGGDMGRHGRTTVEILRKEGYPEEGLQAILAHNGDVLGIDPGTRLDIALLSAETTTGLVVATTLVYPSKKIADLKVKSVLKRMKEPRFAAGVDRSKVMLCEEIDIPLAEFLGIAVDAMRGVAEEIGL
ncbi:MAG: HD domain-containing protein [Pseudomonadota bacterium]